MDIACVWEHNGNDTILYSETCTGAYTRGENRNAALEKMAAEVRSYYAWLGKPAPENLCPVIVQEKKSNLRIRDADSDVLFSSEEEALTWEAYTELKALALKSAADFQKLYDEIPDKNRSALPVRSTFYGQVPRTAEEMYRHTKNVNNYYFGEIGIEADNAGTILECRERGFAALEQTSDFLTTPVREGSYGELWSLRKVLRRFVWHDRIHGKAMWRMARKTFPELELKNIFCFQEGR